MSHLWESVLSGIREKISKQIFDTWFQPIKFLSLDGENIHIEVPNKFFKDWIVDHYLNLLRETINEIWSNPLNINFHVMKSKSIQNAKVTSEKKSTNHDKKKELAHKFKLNPLYSFENFVVGNSNQFAHAATLAVAERHAKTYNPLFIYGGVGLGKTHLLNATGNRMIQANVSLKLHYNTSEKFTNELINSIRYDKMTDFRNKYRNSDVLLIDDIEFIAGKERTQEEFFHTFNSLYDAGKQIVITSDKFPKDIPSLEDRLRSRFEWGLIADIHPPEMETKVAILKKKMSLENVILPDDVAIFLATKVKSNIRELEGLLIRICAYASLTNSEISLSFAQEVLKDLIKDDLKHITVEHIQKVVADYFNIKLSDIKSSKKLRNIAFPRQIAMYLSRKLTKASFPDIGARFGGKNHATIIHAYNKIEALQKKDSRLYTTLEQIEKKL